uniref:Uncharacterized protein n=1 Tax=Plectus sambesii TaxID=2011161 RepID=A0A914ULY2_9BILA
MEFSIIECAPVADAPTEETIPPDPDRNKWLLQKKRRQKLRQKIVAKAKEMESDLTRSKIADGYVGVSPVKTACDKPLRELRRIVESPAFESKCDDSDVHTLERALGEVGRAFANSQQNSAAREVLRKGVWSTGGFDALLSLVRVLEKDTPVIPFRTSVKACHLLDELCSESPFLAAQLLCSQRLLIVADSLTASTKMRANTHMVVGRLQFMAVFTVVGGDVCGLIGLIDLSANRS